MTSKSAVKATAKKTAGQSRQKKPLPEIPDKLYYRIGEVARLCAVETYVLRFWETEFPQLKPNKSGAGQRLYRRREVDLARRIRHLLYEEGYTIPGARQAIQTEARRPAESAQLPLANAGLKGKEQTPRLGRLRTELKEILGMLSTAPGANTAPGSNTALGAKRMKAVDSGRGTQGRAARGKTERDGPELFD